METIRSAAHPRAGGENDLAALFTGFVNGSSPRGRGKPAPRPSLVQLQRLIPARAGKTLAMSSVVYPRAAHPRAGGENVQMCSRIARAIGSSPRGRGKPKTSRVVLPLKRLIPARAGKTP